MDINTNSNSSPSFDVAGQVVKRQPVPVLWGVMTDDDICPSNYFDIEKEAYEYAAKINQQTQNQFEMTLVRLQQFVLMMGHQFTAEEWNEQVAKYAPALYYVVKISYEDENEESEKTEI